MCTISDKRNVQLILQLLPYALEHICIHTGSGIRNSSMKTDNVMNKSAVHWLWQHPTKKSRGVMSRDRSCHTIGPSWWSRNISSRKSLTIRDKWSEAPSCWKMTFGCRSATWGAIKNSSMSAYGVAVTVSSAQKKRERKGQSPCRAPAHNTYSVLDCLFHVPGISGTSPTSKSTFSDY